MWATIRPVEINGFRNLGGPNRINAADPIELFAVPKDNTNRCSTDSSKSQAIRAPTVEKTRGGTDGQLISDETRRVLWVEDWIGGLDE